MKKFDSQTYYEILDLPVQASAFEVREAYKNGLAIYGEDSLATYSFFSREERQHILQRLEEALSTLTDEDRRAAYDQELIEKGEIDAASLEKKERTKVVPLFQTNPKVEKNVLQQKIDGRARDEQVVQLSNEILSKEVICGNDLKTLRETIGISTDEIYEITRITVSTLNAIEQDNYGELPSALFLKNFLKSYAETLKINPGKIIAGYMNGLPRSPAS